ncbi:hypothetical protein [Persicimonas caeni]|nr:hypothetical protein [Persicimonas caeni]
MLTPLSISVKMIDDDFALLTINGECVETTRGPDRPVRAKPG